MTKSARVRWLVSISAIVAAFGVADAALGDTWDLVAVLGVILTLLVVALVTMTGQRSTITIRPDLARWLHVRAAVEGEPLDALVDRAIATYRGQLHPDERSTSAR